MYSTIVIALLFSAVVTTNMPLAFAQDITTGPPPPRPITVKTDKTVYLANETITISGQASIAEAGQQSVSIEIFDPTGKMFAYEARLAEDGTYSYVIGKGRFEATGEYRVVSSYAGQYTVTLFMFVAGPYNLAIDGKNYPIYYRSDSGILNKIAVDTEEKSLTIQITNSSRAGTLKIELPRGVIDAKRNNEDGNFVVLIGNETEFRQANFTEIQVSSDSRTLSINFPYNGTNTLSDTWNVKIIGTAVVPEFSSLGVITLIAMAGTMAVTTVFARKKWASSVKSE